MRVYLITNLVSGSRYVGQTRRTLQERFTSHCQVIGRKNACPALSDAMKKYGTENFKIELLEECANQETLNLRECFWIAELRTMAPAGYNLTPGGGGKGGFQHSDESKRKMAAWQIGKKLTDEHKRKVSVSLIGNKRALGSKHTEETRAKIGAMGKGRKLAPFTAEHRFRIAEARRGKKTSKEACERMSIARLGELNHHAKLTADKVLAIRDDKRKQIEIAAAYGIKQPLVSAIKLRKAWKHVA